MWRRVARGCLQAAKTSKIEGGGGGVFGEFSRWRELLRIFFNAKGFPAFFLQLNVEKGIKLKIKYF
jgi:hypothetical protein